jgi:hypothetical protein
MRKSLNRNKRIKACVRLAFSFARLGISFVLLYAAFILHEYRQLLGVARFPVG